MLVITVLTDLKPLVTCFFDFCLQHLHNTPPPVSPSLQEYQLFLVNASLSLGFPGDSAGKESTCNVGDLGSISGLVRSPGEGKGYPLQYSGLENSMDCIVHGVTKSQTQLNNFNFTSLSLQSPMCPRKRNSSSPEPTAGKMCLMENRTTPFWFSF